MCERGVRGMCSFKGDSCVCHVLQKASRPYSNIACAAALVFLESVINFEKRLLKARDGAFEKSESSFKYCGDGFSK